MQQGGGQQQTDQTASFFWYIALITVVVILVWVFGKKYLVPPLFYLRLGEVHVLEWIFTGWNYVAGLLHLPLADANHYHNIQQFMQTAAAKKVTIEQVSYINDQVGKPYRYPFAIILIALAYISFFKHRSAQFTSTYSMKTLRKSEAVNWPHIMPILGSDLLKEKLDQGAWAMAKTPMGFSKENDVLAVTEKNSKKVWTIKHGAAERLFVLQMGPLWEGVDKLPMHIKALIVIILSHIDRKKEQANQLLDQISLSASGTVLNFAGVEQHLQHYKSHKALKWTANRHAYVYTVMATLLDLGRVEGVLATAEFLWLKPLDRRLWYVLNSVGRNTPVVEAAGVYAHWLAEKKLQRALRTPIVNEAVVALDKAVSNILYTQEEDRWHTSNVA